MALSLAYAVPETQTGPPLSAHANPVHGPVGTLVAAWPAVALVGSCELLMVVIRSSQAAPDGISGNANNPDPLGDQAAEIFAAQLAQLAADRVPSIRAAPHWPARAQRLRDYLAAGTAERAESPAV